MDSQKPYRIPEFLLNSNQGENPLKESDMKEIENILDFSASFVYPETKTEQQWQKLSAQLQSPLKVTKKPTRFAMFRWAAAAIVVLTLGIGFWQYQANQYPLFTATYTSDNHMQTVTLPDGSVVTLNAETTLEVVGINPNKRVLRLQSGEIFLKVQHSDVPFRVKTSKGDITVLGTEFTVRDIKTEPFSVYLKTGKIQFETADEKRILSPGENIASTADGNFIISTLKDNRAYAWTDGKLTFENSSLSEIVAGLETLYKVKFEYDTTLGNEKLTITFENLSAEQAAELLGKTVNSEVSIAK